MPRNNNNNNNNNHDRHIALYSQWPEDYHRVLNKVLETWSNLPEDKTIDPDEWKIADSHQQAFQYGLLQAFTTRALIVAPNRKDQST